MKIIGSYIGVVIILFWCIQPQYFQVDYQKSSVSLYPVYASSNESDSFAWIKLDNLIVGEDGSSKISYSVKANDTVASIAQQFGTTVQSIKDGNGLWNEWLKIEQVIYITFDNGVMVNVKEAMTLQQFVTSNNLDLADTMSLNYFTSADLLLDQDQEIFVNLTQKEAEKRGLIEKQPYESPFEKLKEAQILEQEEDSEAAPEEDFGPVQQQVISPQETASQIAAQFKKEVPLEQIEDPTQEEQVSNAPLQCGSDSCLSDTTCVPKPQFAYCTKNDPKHLWKCKQGFQQQGNDCIAVKGVQPVKQVTAKATIEVKKVVKPSSEKKKIITSKTIAVGYFNPRSDGVPPDGRGPGQCTSFAHRYWWKHYGIKSMGFRGNGWQWAARAKNAWWVVNKTPSIWAIGVSNESSVGHVFVVIGIDGDKVLIQEMNYAGRYIVTKRWKSVSSVKAFIHPTKVK